MLRSEDTSSAFVLSQHKYLVPATGKGVGSIWLILLFPGFLLVGVTPLMPLALAEEATIALNVCPSDPLILPLPQEEADLWGLH